MILKYRGITYTISDTATIIDSEMTEGKYHGIQTQIRLPLVRKGFAAFQELITYRGKKLAV